MYYTTDMRVAFATVIPPKDFKVKVVDQSTHLEIVIDPHQILNIDEGRQAEIVSYLNAISKALLSEGADITLTREAIADES